MGSIPTFGTLVGLKRALPLLGVLVVLPSCGGDKERGLDDGFWFGAVREASISQRTVTFAPVCRLGGRRWLAVDLDKRRARRLRLSPDPKLQIYFRPDGSAARGHGQTVDIRGLAGVIGRTGTRSFPPGWWVVVRDGRASVIAEDSGVRSTGQADRRTFACIWNRHTQRFVTDVGAPPP